MKTKSNLTSLFFIAALGGALFLSACGGSGDSEATPSAAEPSKGSTSTSASEAAPGPVDQTVEITGNDQMKFNIESFTVSKGSTVKIHLKNVGSMPKMSMGHNVVVLKIGTDEEAFVEAAMQAAANDYIPEGMSDSIIAHTKMTGGGEEASVTFKVPEQTGDYTFICSFPGHFQVGMKGTMVVE